MTAFAVMAKRYRKSRFDQTNYRSCGRSRAAAESITGSPKPPNLFLRPPSPRPSPQGEGIAVVRFPFARRRSCHFRRTTFQRRGERFSFSPWEKAGMRASVKTILHPSGRARWAARAAVLADGQHWCNVGGDPHAGIEL